MRSTKKIFFNRLSSGRLTFIVLASAKSHNQDCRHHDVGNRYWKQNLPAQFHELIVPVPGPAGAEPKIEIDENNDFEREPHDRGNDVEESQRRNVWERPEPSAQEQRDRHCRYCNHVRIFSEEEQGEPETAVFSVEARDEFGLRFGKIEGSTVRFSNTADKEKDKCYGLIEDVPDSRILL